MPFMPPVEWLLERFYIDDVGTLRHKQNKGPVVRAGDPAGTLHKKSGYVHVNVMHEGTRKKLCAHRMIWSMHNKVCVPDDIEIDHRNRVRAFNHPDNLVALGRVANQLNTSTVISAIGVSIDAKNKGKPYRARIRHGGKRLTIGNFASHEEAQRAYQAAAKRRQEEHHAGHKHVHPQC